MLRDMASNWAKNEQPVTKWRAVRDSGTATGYDPAVYSEMAQMGWTGIVIPEEYGGSDFGYVGMGLILEECGRTLVASPIAASALGAASAITLGGSEEQKQAWLPGIASGEVIGTLAIDEGPNHNPTNIETTATKSGDGYVLNGTKAFVAEGDSATLFVVAAKTDAGNALFLVPGDADGLSRSSRSVVDQRSHAEITLKDVSVGTDALLGDDTLIEQVLDRARAGAAAEMLGMAAEAFDVTLEYLKTRSQFGQLLSSFQALQHRMAHLFTEIELMRSVVENALEAIDQNRNDVASMVSLAKAYANDTIHLMSKEMLQLHGGIGMTDEHDAGLYLKRARTLENAWGNASFHRDRYGGSDNGGPGDRGRGYYVLEGATMWKEKNDWLMQVREVIIDPTREIVDPHHHLWHIDRTLYDLEDLWSDTDDGHNVVQTVFMECGSSYDQDAPEQFRPIGETRYVADRALKSAKATDKATIAAIISHADLTNPDLDDVLDAHEEAGQGLFRGIRHAGARIDKSVGASIPGRAPERLYADPKFRAGVARLGERGLTYDTWHYHTQNQDFRDLAMAVPDTQTVLDHFGTPVGIGPYEGKRDEIFAVWKDDVAAIAADCPNVVAKLGGMAMPDNGFGWDTRDIPPTSDEFVEQQARYYHHMIQCFGPDRCMFESNFPVDRLSLSYHVLWNGLKKIAADYSDDDQNRLFSGTARRIYRL
ncbi:yngJ [Symbiodinium microadriaticum]|nr:yngJ [Symbiodinium microadriaticum]